MLLKIQQIYKRRKSAYCIALLSLIFNLITISNATSNNDSLVNYYLNKSINTINENPQEALNTILKCVEIAEISEDKKKLALAYSQASYIYQVLSSYQKALKYSMKHFEISLQLKDTFSIADAYNNISNIYFNLNEFKNAFKYAKLSANLFKLLNNYNALGNTYNNMAIYAEYTEELTLADSLYQLSLYYFSKNGSDNDIALSYMNYGDFIVKLKKYNLALDYQKKAETSFLKNNDKYHLCYTYAGISNNFFEQKKFSDALIYSEKAISIATELNLIKELSTIYSISSKIYAGLNDKNKAYDYLSLSVNLRDSILSDEDKKLITQLQIAHESEQKQKEIELLQLEKQFQSSIISKSRQFIAVLIGASLILLLLAILIFKQLKTISKAKKTIEIQKTLVEEKQKEIIDSIHYAKRIQLALLPPENYINRIILRLKNKN